MSLVDYSSSEDEVGDEFASTPPTKKRKLSPKDHEKQRHTSDLPPLPSSFLDQYSSTVRTSTHDDPSMHGGRKRVTPHVVGNWPTHVYLEWCPTQEEAEVLSELIVAAAAAAAGGPTTEIHERKRSSSQIEADASQTTSKADKKVHSLLENDLGVPLPLHISLSRPLVLKTDQKEAFLQQLTEQLNGSETFAVLPQDLVWHPNESDTRWFLVLRLDSPTSGALGGMKELNKLLGRCNDVAKRFGQPILYQSESDSNLKAGSNAKSDQDLQNLDQDRFHISLAWSLQSPLANIATGDRAVAIENANQPHGRGVAIDSQHELLGRIRSIDFTEVKLRIGQDVHRLPLKKRRHSYER